MRSNIACGYPWFDWQNEMPIVQDNTCFDSLPLTGNLPTDSLHTALDLEQNLFVPEGDNIYSIYTFIIYK